MPQSTRGRQRRNATERPRFSTWAAIGRWQAVSALFAHQPRFVALPVAFLDSMALVDGLLAPGQRQFDLRPPGAVEIDRKRDQRHALALDRAHQALDFA